MFGLKATASGLQIIVPPHLKVAREVVNPETIFQEAKEISAGMKNDTFVYPNTLWPTAIALAQPQVSRNPLRYFVINPDLEDIIVAFGGPVIVNPHLVSKDKMTKFMFKDACLSYPLRPKIKVKRFSKIVVSYDIITSLKTDRPDTKRVVEKELSDLPALIFQHELEHMNGKSLFTK